MNRLEHLIEELNSALYNPVGLNILWPRDVGFLFVRFPARVADDRLTNHGHSVLFCVARDRILRQLPFTRSDHHACLMSRSNSNDANLVGSPPHSTDTPRCALIVCYGISCMSYPVPTRLDREGCYNELTFYSALRCRYLSSVGYALGVRK